MPTYASIVGRSQSCKLIVKRSQPKIKNPAAENRRLVSEMQDFTGAKPNMILSVW